MVDILLDSEAAVRMRSMAPAARGGWLGVLFEGVLWGTASVAPAAAAAMSEPVLWPKLPTRADPTAPPTKSQEHPQNDGY